MGGKSRSLGHCASNARKSKFSPPRSKMILLAAMGAVLAAPAAVHALPFNWNINASGLFDTAANWTPAGPPATSLDNVIFDQTGTYTVFFQTNKTNGNFFVTNGNVTLALDGQTYTLASLSEVGDINTSTARLTLSNGTVSGTSLVVGAQTAATGFLTVSANALLNLSATLGIGTSGSGTLSLQNGGDITSVGGTIGSGATSVGTATVSGAGSTWSSSGQFLIADAGVGTLSITAGGVVNANSGTNTTLGLNSGAEGTLTVSGLGSTLNSVSSITMGLNGTANVTVSSGGNIHGNSAITLGSGNSGNGTLTVTGAGSTVTSGSGLTAGNSGAGTVNVLAGGILSSTSGTIASLSGASTRGAVLVDGAGSRWNLTSQLSVGNSATGTLTISNGGVVNVVPPANTFVGNLTGGSGTMTVSGAGSAFVGGNLQIGSASAGTLNINDGASVTAATFTIAGGTGGSGIATLSGDGSVLNANVVNIGTSNSGNATLAVGAGTTVNTNGLNLNAPSAGTGALFLDTGGTVNINGNFSRRGAFTLRGNLNVTAGVFSNGTAPAQLIFTAASPLDAGPVLRLSGTASTSNISDMQVGLFNHGAVEVLSGADLSISGLALLGGGGGTGSVLVDGSGSTWNCTGALDLGASSAGGGGIVTISNGGLVSSASSLVGYVANTSGLVSVSGAGSLWKVISGTMSIGEAGSGIVTVSDSANAIAQGIVLGQSNTADGLLTVRDQGTVSGTSLLIGAGGKGTLKLESGGIVNISGSATISNALGATGTATVSGSGSSLTAGSLLVGTAFGDTANLSVLNGGFVTANSLSLTDPGGAPTGTLLIDGGNITINGSFTRRGTLDFRHGTLTINAGTFDNAAGALPLVINGSAAGKLPALRLTGNSALVGISDLTVGNSGAASLYVQKGSTANISGNLSIGALVGSSGSVLLEGFMNVAGAARVGGNITFGGVGTLSVQPGGSINVGTNLNLFTMGAVHLNGGTINMGELLPNGGTFDFQGGTVDFNSDVSFDGRILDTLFGTTHQVVGGQFLRGDGNISLTSNLALNGGDFEAVNDLTVQSRTFVRAMQGIIRAENNLNNNGVISVEGGVVRAGVSLVNSGEIQVHGGTSLIDAFEINNGGLITGSGQVTAGLNNLAGGEVRASGTERLSFGFGGTNTGLINVFDGGIVEFRSALTNAAGGRINGRGMIVARGGVTNNGQIAFSAGLTDFLGPVTNNSGGKIIITGNGMATFYDTITHNAGAEIRVSAGSTAVFLGAVNGVGIFSGSGAKYFEGGGSAVGPVITPGSTVVEAAASLSATLIREDSLTVNGGVSINTSGGTSHLNHLSIAPDGVLDLKNNSLVLEGGNLATITSQIRSGLYDAVGIVSSAPGSPFRLGSMSNAGPMYTTFQGISGLDGDEVLIRYTRIGDLNLDGTVTISDFIDLASHFGSVGGATWQMGDVNYDGSVTISDFIDLASNFGQSVSGEALPISADEAAMLVQFAADHGASAVPEPSTLLLGIVIAAGVRRRYSKCCCSCLGLTRASRDFV